MTGKAFRLLKCLAHNDCSLKIQRKDLFSSMAVHITASGILVE